MPRNQPFIYPTVPPNLLIASMALSGVTFSTIKNSAEVPGCSMPRTWSWNSRSIPVLVILPMMAPRPAPTAMPNTGMKNSRPNSMPQNIPHVAPAPTGWWLVCTWYPPSWSRTIDAIASGSMMRSRASRRASSAAASAVASSGYPMAIKSAITSCSPSARILPGRNPAQFIKSGARRAPPQAGDTARQAAPAPPRQSGSQRLPARSHRGLGVTPLLVDLRRPAVLAPHGHEGQGKGQAQPSGDHQDHADDLEIHVRGLPGNSKPENCADNNKCGAATDCHRNSSSAGLNTGPGFSGTPRPERVTRLHNAGQQKATGTLRYVMVIDRPRSRSAQRHTRIASREAGGIILARIRFVH